MTEEGVRGGLMGGLCWVSGTPPLLPAWALVPPSQAGAGIPPPPHCDPRQHPGCCGIPGDPVTPRRICYDPAQLWPHPLGGEIQRS